MTNGIWQFGLIIKILCSNINPSTRLAIIIGNIHSYIAIYILYRPFSGFCISKHGESELRFLIQKIPVRMATKTIAIRMRKQLPPIQTLL